MYDCDKKKLIQAVSQDVEKLLEQQIGEKFALLEIVKRDGQVVTLRSNAIESVDIDDNSLPTKGVLLEDVECESIVTFTGSPRCRLRKSNGRGSMTNLVAGGSVDDCFVKR